MSKLTKFNDSEIANTENVKGGFFFLSAPKTSYCAPQQQSYYAPQQPTCYAPQQPTYCAPKPSLPKISLNFSWGFGGGCW